MIKPNVLKVVSFDDPSNMVVIRMRFIIWEVDVKTAEFVIVNPYLGEFLHPEFYQWLNDY